MRPIFHTAILRDVTGGGFRIAMDTAYVDWKAYKELRDVLEQHREQLKAIIDDGDDLVRIDLSWCPGATSIEGVVVQVEPRTYKPIKTVETIKLPFSTKQAA